MGLTMLPAEARDRLAAAELTDREVGATAGDLPHGYHHLTRRVLIGHGRRGFAYGTLPGHPESGEEAFVIERHDDDTVSFTITAFSRHATRLARVAGPLGRAAQRRITARYLRSLPT